MSDQHDPQRNAEIADLQRLIARGFDAEAFMRSDIGKYLRARASKELEDAQDELLTVPVHDIARITELQLQGRVAGKVLTYIADMVAEGEAAQEQFRQTFDESQPT